MRIGACVLGVIDRNNASEHRMALVIREVREQELDAVLALNNSAGPGILPVDSTRIRQLFDIAAYFRVAEIDGVIGGFLIALTPEAAYDSLNFAWFKSRYTGFVYIDRIVIARPYRGLGLGRIFYADVQSFADVRSPLLCCEVFLDPRDDVSVLFTAPTASARSDSRCCPTRIA
jgi:predicted GNAT superfamily acetyltransferase